MVTGTNVSMSQVSQLSCWSPSSGYQFTTIVNVCSQNFHGDRHQCASLANPRMLISVRVTTSSYGTNVFRCSITIPITTLSTLRRSTLPCLTQDSLLMLRLTAYQVDVSCPLYEAPLAGRTDRYVFSFISRSSSCLDSPIILYASFSVIRFIALVSLCDYLLFKL